MMAEKKLENQVCGNCGASERKNSQFCYNCGFAVGAEAENASKVTSSLDEKALPIEKPSIPLTVGENLELLSKTEAKMPSAAELRQKNKLERKKSVEITWEDPEDAPNVWFVVAAFILTLFAVCILFAMLYIR